MKKIVGIIVGLLLVASVAAAEYGGEIQVQTLAKSTVSWDGQTLPAYPMTQPEITALRIQVPPGASLPRHQHPLINAGFLISGDLTVIKEGGEVLHLKAGDAIVELVNTWHYGKNEGDVPVDIVVFYMGSPGLELSVKEE